MSKKIFVRNILRDNAKQILPYKRQPPFHITPPNTHTPHTTHKATLLESFDRHIIREQIN